jgi:hypothetical protein
MLDTTPLLEALTGELARVEPDLLVRFDLSTYISHLDACEHSHGYRYVPPQIQALCQALADRHGTHALESYHRLLLGTLIARYEERVRLRRLTPTVRGLTQHAHRQILRHLASSRPGYFLHENDLFAKDLAVCRAKLLPCGAELIDPSAGIPRRILVSGGIFQALRAGRHLIARCGGFKPWYESHWDRRRIALFSRDSYDQCYLNIADLLASSPDTHGVFGSSWWYDPEVEKISPELGFLRSVPEANGAKVFRVGVDPSSTRDALRLAPARRTVYESGAYVPTVYMLVWSRESMLRWAVGFRRKIASAQK